MPLHVAPQIGTKYVLTRGSYRATFNDPTDTDNVGVLTNATGLDSAEVRDDGEVLVRVDGGVQGPSLYGRRPVVFEGLIYGHSSAAVRNVKLAKLRNVVQAMGDNVRIDWQSAGGAAVYSTFRQQQPMKVTGGWNKAFQVSLVAADPRFYAPGAVSTSTRTSAGASTLVNNGNAMTFPYYTVKGPIGTTPLVIAGDGGQVAYFNRVIPLEEGYLLDGLNRTVTRFKRRVNQFRNPSFENASTVYVQNTMDATVTDFVSTGSPTLDAHATPPVTAPHGSKALKITTTGTGSTAPPDFPGGKMALAALQWDPAITGHETLFRIDPNSFDPAVHYTLAASFLRATAAAAYKGFIHVTWFMDNQTGGVDALLSSQNYAITAAGLSDTVWNRLSLSVPPDFYSQASSPVGGYFTVQVGVINTAGNTATAQVYYVDAVTIEKTTSDSSFFYPDGTIYKWEGTTDASRTYSEDASSFEPLANAYDVIDVGNTKWAGLLPGSNTMNYGAGTTFGTGASIKTDWRDAWL